jgi:hypothetical protein
VLLFGSQHLPRPLLKQRRKGRGAESQGVTADLAKLDVHQAIQRLPPAQVAENGGSIYIASCEFNGCHEQYPQTGIGPIGERPESRGWKRAPPRLG